jgi:hypothetical protein
VKPKHLCSLTTEVLVNLFSFFMADGPTAKKALSKTINTGSLNYIISRVMKKVYGNKTKASHRPAHF